MPGQCGSASSPDLGPALVQGALGGTPPTATFWAASKNSAIIRSSYFPSLPNRDRVYVSGLFLQDQVKPLAALELEAARRALVETVRAAHLQPCCTVPVTGLSYLCLVCSASHCTIEPSLRFHMKAVWTEAHFQQLQQQSSVSAV